jgi:hypothetical protein
MEKEIKRNRAQRRKKHSARMIKRAERFKNLQAQARELREKEDKSKKEEAELFDLQRELTKMLTVKGGSKYTPPKKRRK